MGWNIKLRLVFSLGDLSDCVQVGDFYLLQSVQTADFSEQVLLL